MISMIHDGIAHNHLFSLPIPRKRQTSIRYKYIIFSSILFLIILLIGSIAFVTLMLPIAHANFKTELMWNVERERRRLEAELSSKIVLVQKMSNSLLIRRHLHNPSDRWIRNMAFDELASYANAFTPSEVFWISDSDKKYYFKGKYLYTLDPTKKDSEWYGPTLNMTSPFQLKVNFDPGLKKTMLWIDAPVFDDKHIPIGLVGVGLYLDNLVNNIFQSYQRNDELYFFNIDGEITGARDISLIENIVNMADHLGQSGREILAVTKELSGNNGVQCFETDSKLTIAIDSIPILSWYVVAVHHFTFRESMPMGMTILFISIMTIIFICFAVLNLYVVKILNPFNSFVKTLGSTLVAWELKQHEEDTGEMETLGEFVTMAIIDPLTKVYNRRYFDGQMKKTINSLAHSGSKFSLLLVDVDHFKTYNDVYGHNAGDNCLKKVAAAMTQCISRNGDFVARYGGEEFAVVLPNTDKAGVQLIAYKLLESIQECDIPHKASGVAKRVTISIGGTTATVNHSHCAEDYIKFADQALYESKRGGRNRYTHKTFGDYVLNSPYIASP